MSAALVSGAFASAGNATVATTSAIDTTGANLIVVAGVSLSATASIITDSKSNTWTALTEQDSDGAGRIRLFYCYNPTVGSGHTFTNTGAVVTICVAAFSGIGASPFDQQNGANNDSTGPATFQPGSITPTENGELLIVADSCRDTDGNQTCDNGFALITNIILVGGTNYACDLFYLVQATAAAINPTISGFNTGENGRTAVIASFKATASADALFAASWS